MGRLCNHANAVSVLGSNPVAVDWSASFGAGIAQITGSQAVPNDLQGEEMLALLAQDPTQTLYITFIEFAVSRGRTFGIDQPLALEKADFGDGDVGELFSEQRQDIANGQVRTATHSSPATK
jgi:hypothetical protein